MKKISLIGIALVCSAVTSHAADTLLKTQKDKISYGIGVDMIQNFKQQGVDFDLELVIKGMRDSASGAKLLQNASETRKLLNDYNRELKAKQSQARSELATKNKKEGDAYLAANSKNPGVVTTASGLQYKIIKAGTGPVPTMDDSVTCRYRGTLIDGTEFDSTDRVGGYPLTFNVRDSVVGGWVEALLLMPAGSKWQVIFPSELGYGEKGAGKDVGPNAVLIYEIELLAVNPTNSAVEKPGAPVSAKPDTHSTKKKEKAK